MTGSTITYGGERISFSVVENPKISGKVRIHVYPYGSVKVETPLNTPGEEIFAAMRKRVRWVSKQLQLQREGRLHALPREYRSGETHFYLGRRYVLKALQQDACPSAVKLKGGQLQVTTKNNTVGEIKKTLTRWYRLRADDYFKKRLREISANLGWVDSPPGLKLRVMRTQWGSCSPAGLICINPRLIRAPRDCIDYVLLHELCHLRQHNHSKRFYNLLDKNLPNWRHVKSRLDGMAELLLVE
ncbi:SprT family zinc-dependent metalloprotease [Henriciella sp.]|uniref:M48 family metallopeptidase n=1 Tax=Henriciella sp. TaxID=1968823 RepID=UPI00260E5349|nr:SprT family zinc-dependent metalloprotease [Henriciella sp.]